MPNKTNNNNTSCPWGSRHRCEFGMNPDYSQEITCDATMTPRQLRNTLYDDRECLTIHQYKRKHRNWKNNRSTQYTKPEPSAKALMDTLVIVADME